MVESTSSMNNQTVTTSPLLDPLDPIILRTLPRSKPSDEITTDAHVSEGLRNISSEANVSTHNNITPEEGPGMIQYVNVFSEPADIVLGCLIIVLIIVALSGNCLNFQ